VVDPEPPSYQVYFPVDFRTLLEIQFS
jgi:hypothetical protein